MIVSYALLPVKRVKFRCFVVCGKFYAISFCGLHEARRFLSQLRSFSFPRLFPRLKTPIRDMARPAAMVKASRFHQLFSLCFNLDRLLTNQFPTLYNKQCKNAQTFPKNYKNTCQQCADMVQYSYILSYYRRRQA